MILLPYEQLTIKTTLRAEEARDKLAQITEPDRLFRWWWTEHKPYEGKIEGYNFEVSRVINYRNSFLPFIAGQIQPEMGGCSIRMTMRPHILILALVALGLAVGVFVILVSLGSLIASAANANADQSSALAGVLIPAAILVSGYGAVLLGFKLETAKSKAFFRRLFQANQANEAGRINFFRKA